MTVIKLLGLYYFPISSPAYYAQKMFSLKHGDTVLAATAQKVPTRPMEMRGESTEDTNSITEPTKIVPVTRKIDGLSKDFTRTFPPYSISILKLKGK